MSYHSGIKDPVDGPFTDSYIKSNGMQSYPGGSPPGAYFLTPFSPRYEEGNSPNLPALSEETLKLAMKSVVDLFVLEEDHVDPNAMDVENEDDEEPPVDLEDQAKRVQRLGDILPALEQLWWNKSEHLAGAAEKLADGSRDRKLFCYVRRKETVRYS